MSSDPSEGPALGNDPFTGGDGTLPYLLKLRERTVRMVEEEAESPPEGLRVTPRPSGPPDLGPPIPEVQSFDDSDEAAGWLDQLAARMLDPGEEERLARVLSTLDVRSYDELGLCPRTSRRAFAFFKLLYRYYFRVESTGHQHIPEKEGAIIACNHGGLLPFDATMIIIDGVLAPESPRWIRAIVDRWAGTLPFVNVFYSRVGQVIGTRDNFRKLLRGGEVALVFPEGMAGVRKRAAERYVLQRFNVGFIEESIRNRVPIIPTALVGADDQAPVLWNLKPLARLLGMPFFPVTPTFPLLGPLGLLPYPVKYDLTYGEPFRFYEEFPAEVGEDAHAVRYMAEQVRRRIQEMVDRRVMARRARKG